MGDLFNWTTDLEVGNEFIDRDHKRLVQMINDFHSAMQEGRGNEVVGAVLRNLIIYTRDHFKREEDEMKRIGYYKSLTHHQEHTKLLTEVVNLQLEVDTGQQLLSTKVSRMLKAWLLDHIDKSDYALSLAIKSHSLNGAI